LGGKRRGLNKGNGLKASMVAWEICGIREKRKQLSRRPGPVEYKTVLSGRVH